MNGCGNIPQSRHYLFVQKSYRLPRQGSGICSLIHTPCHIFLMIGDIFTDRNSECTMDVESTMAHHRLHASYSGQVEEGPYERPLGWVPWGPLESSKLRGRGVQILREDGLHDVDEDLRLTRGEYYSAVILSTPSCRRVVTFLFPTNVGKNRFGCCRAQAAKCTLKPRFLYFCWIWMDRGVNKINWGQN